MSEPIDRARLLEIAREAMGESRPMPNRPAGHFLHHGRRTAGIAVRLLERLEVPPSEIDPETMWAAGLFHDVGKGEDPHEEVGATRARELLEPVFDPPRLDAIAGWIRRHNHRGRPDLSLAAHVLQDADMLDHHGAQIAWLAFQWAAANGQDPWESVGFYFGEQHSRYLDGCREALNLDASREVFDRRRRIGDDFFRRFRAELNGEL